MAAVAAKTIWNIRSASLQLVIWPAELKDPIKKSPAPKRPAVLTPNMSPYPTRMKPKHPRANEIMFFMITVTAFLARVDPTSTRVAPASIKRIKKDDRRVQTMSMAAGW